MSITGKAAIIGFAEMAPQKGDGDKTPLGIISEVTRAALADAGLEKKDLDGLLTGWALGEYSVLWPSVVAEYLQLQPRYFSQIELGGASAAGMVWRAGGGRQGGGGEKKTLRGRAAPGGRGPRATTPPRSSPRAAR